MAEFLEAKTRSFISQWLWAQVPPRKSTLSSSSEWSTNHWQSWKAKDHQHSLGAGYCASPEQTHFHCQALHSFLQSVPNLYWSTVPSTTGRTTGWFKLGRTSGGHLFQTLCSHLTILRWTYSCVPRYKKMALISPSPQQAAHQAFLVPLGGKIICLCVGQVFLLGLADTEHSFVTEH